MLLLCSFSPDIVTSYLKEDVVMPFGSHVKCPPSIAKCWEFVFPHPPLPFGWIVCRYLNFMNFSKILVDNPFNLLNDLRCSYVLTVCFKYI